MRGKAVALQQRPLHRQEAEVRYSWDKQVVAPTHREVLIWSVAFANDAHPLRDDAVPVQDAARVGVDRRRARGLEALQDLWLCQRLRGDQGEAVNAM